DSRIGARPIIAHCAVIERTLLRRAYQDCLYTLTNPFIDTAVLAAAALNVNPGGAAIALEYAAGALGVPRAQPTSSPRRAGHHRQSLPSPGLAFGTRPSRRAADHRGAD